MQFAENFHQSKPEPVQFARAARAIMSEDTSLTAAEVSRLVGAPLDWTRKALRLLDLPEAIVARVEQGDLSFTAADVVRRGIARGDVSAERAEDLVDQHAEGESSSNALKLGVGYVPPKPKDYDELSRKLDEARWAAARDSDKPGPRRRAARLGRRRRGPRDRPPRRRGPQRRRAGAPAARAARAERGSRRLRARPRPGAGRDPGAPRRAGHRAATRPPRSTRSRCTPTSASSVLRALAGELLAADPAPPRALDGILAG